MSIEIPLYNQLTVEQAIAAANSAKRAAQQALANIPAAIDAEVGPAAAPYITQASNAKDAALVAQAAAEAARDSAIAAERRMRTQSLGTFANDAAAVAWAAAQTPPITIVTGTSYLNSTTDVFRYAVVSAGPTITWHDVTEDEAAQAALATASATAAQNALSDFLTRYVGAFNSTPTYVGDTAPWSVGALYWNKLQGKFFVWSGSTWTATDATAQQAKIDAEAAASSAAQIAVGLSYDEYTLDGVSALDQGAVISFPKGLFVLNGNRVSLDTLLAASTAQKRILGPDGNYLTSDANTIAQDWSTGRRRLLIETIGFENIVITPETPSGWFGGAGSVASTANGYRGIFNRVTITSGATGVPVLSTGKVMTAGQKLSFSATFKAGTLDKPSFGFATAGSFAVADANCYARIKSGPGVLVKGPSVAMWYIEGAAADTEIEAWCIASASCTLYLVVYDYEALYGSPSAGKTFDLCCPQVGVGDPRSYVPNNTPCAGDVVTAASGLLALLQAGGTLFIRGRGRAGVSGLYPIIGSTNRNASVEVSVYDAYAISTAIDVLNAVPPAPPMTDFGIAASWTAGQRKLAVNGGAVVVDNAALFSASDAGVQLFYGIDGYANGELDELVFIPAYATNNSSLAAQARVYS